MPRPRLFFVDDEPQILSGLRRMLRARKDEWDMHFFDDAEAALAAARDTPPTLVVTDIRMPGTDGVALMSELARRSPATIRFVLSGHSQEEAGLRAAGVAHQYLSKPTDGAVLTEAIERALALRGVTGADPVRRIVASLTSVPTLPAIYTRLTDQLRRDPFNTTAIARTVESDPGVTAKLMQVANSSFYGAPKRIASSRAAVQLLGIDTLKALVLTHGMLAQLVNPRIAGVPVAESLVDRMLVNASVAERVARDLGRTAGDRELTYTAALLADIGLLVLLDNFPDAHAESGLLAPLDIDRLIAFQECRFGVHHAAIGAQLLATWGLPDRIVDAIAAQAGRDGPAGGPAQCLAIARRVVAAAASGTTGGDWPADWPIDEWRSLAEALLRAGG